MTGGQILLSLAGMDGDELFDPTLLGTAEKVGFSLLSFYFHVESFEMDKANAENELWTSLLSYENLIPQVYEQRVGDNEMIVIEGCSRCVAAYTR